MADKDVTEKLLEDYNDVFADIVNVLLFAGKQIIRPEELRSRKPRSAYKADGRLRELERDVMKEWVQNHIRIACLGLENQTNPDPYMALRTMGYDGQEYSSQLKDLKSGQKPAPVITLVLYFGYEKRWTAPTTLIEALNVPELFRPYVTDAKINLFEIAWLSKEQVNLFQSDFRVVADYFVQMRENRDYKPSEEKLAHIQEVLQLLNVMDRDHRFEQKQNEAAENRKEAETMSEWLSRVINESEAKGRAEGEAKGRAEGEAKGRAEGEAKGRAEGEAKGQAKGRTEGTIRTLWELVSDHLIDIDIASARVNMSVTEFQEKAKALMAEKPETYQP